MARCRSRTAVRVRYSSQPSILSRWRLFRAVAEAVDAKTVLYPGCYVDIAPSFVFPSVTYVDSDRRAPRFFGDEAGVREIVGSHTGAPVDPEIVFLSISTSLL